MFTRFKTAIIASALGIAVIATVVAAFLVFAPKQDLAADQYPDRFGVQLQLPKNSGSIRSVEMYADLRTPKLGIEDHANGTTTHYRYRPDGTLASATLYAAADATGKREVIRNSTMAPDGFTYVKDLEYFPDGTVRKDIELAADGTTHRRFFHANGVLAKSQVMEYEWRVWKLMSEQAFFDNGDKAREFLITRGKSLEDTIYGADEKLSAVKKHDYIARTYKETWYFEDGKTPLKLVEQDSEGTKAVVKRKDGSIAEEYIWSGEVKKSGITVYVYDKAGRKRLEQSYWWSNDTALRLRSVEVFDSAGNLTNFVMFYTSGPEAGKVEAEADFHGPGGFSKPHERREYRKDGTLAVVKQQQNSGTVTSEVAYSAERNIRPKTNPEWVARHMVDTPPQMVTYVPPRD